MALLRMSILRLHLHLRCRLLVFLPLRGLRCALSQLTAEFTPSRQCAKAAMPIA